jgi:TonB family protein
MISASASQRTTPPGAAAEWPAGLRKSLLLHLAVLILGILHSLVFSSPTVIRHAPTLRVDLVGLPDQLKQEARPTATQTTTPQAAVPPPEPPTPESKVERTSTPKTKPPEKTPIARPRKSPREKDPPPSKSQLSNALARAKALARVREAYAPRKHSGSPGAAIQGNQLSAGTSLSGDARENAEAHYYDRLRDRLIENWALPVWLSRQKLSARVQLRLDARGRVLLLQFRQSSGNAQFDEEVRRAIRASEPFPLPPPDLTRWISSEGVLVGFPL